MTFFKNTTIGKKLFIGFSMMIIFIGVTGVTGYYSVNKVEKNLEEIFSVRLPSINYLIQADRDLQQLLVAERSMIFSNSKSDVFKGLVEEYENNLRQAETRWNKYKALNLTTEEKAVIPVYEKAGKEWKTISRRVVDGRIADTRKGRREAIDLSLGLAKEHFEKMRDNLDKLTEINLNVAKKARDEAIDIYKRAMITLLGVSLMGLVIGIVLAWLIGRGVTRPLKRAINGVTQASEQVAGGAEQLSDTGQQLAEGSSEQAASIEETSSSLEEMASMTRMNAENANQADLLMKESLEIVNNSNQSMGRLTKSMEEISEAGNETSKIVKTIDEIAFQTNLLALNAAVEAARAGEAGAGFAVVADEVRNLAMRAADAAKNTAELIDGTLLKVGQGADLVTLTNDSFGQVSTRSGKVADLVAEIAAASNEQAEGIEQVNRAVNEMDAVTRENSASAGESATASEEMTSQAALMQDLVLQLLSMVTGNGSSQRALELPDSIREASRGTLEGNRSPVKLID